MASGTTPSPQGGQTGDAVIRAQALRFSNGNTTIERRGGTGVLVNQPPCHHAAISNTTIAAAADPTVSRCHDLADARFGATDDSG